MLEFRQLAQVVESVARFRAMQHVGHPPGKVLCAPRAAEADFGVSFQQLRNAGAIKPAIACERMRTSAAARLSPLAPVGGTMCAASPARNKRPYCIGSATKLRIAVMLF